MGEGRRKSDRVDPCLYGAARVSAKLGTWEPALGELSVNSAAHSNSCCLLLLFLGRCFFFFFSCSFPLCSLPSLSLPFSPFPFVVCIFLASHAIALCAAAACNSDSRASLANIHKTSTTPSSCTTPFVGACEVEQKQQQCMGRG